MSFGFPLGLLALLSLPVILAFHFFVKKRKKLEVSALFLWREKSPLETRQGGQKYTIPPLTASLIFELLLALILSLLIADIAFSSRHQVPHYIFILDDSASMQARVEGESFRQRAIEKVEEICQKESSQLHISLIQTGQVPDILAFFQPYSEGREKLSKWNPKQAYHSPLPALSLARQLGQKKARIIYITDTPPAKDIWDRQGEVISLGEPVNNAGIVSLQVQWKDKKPRALIMVQNFSSRPRKSSLYLTIKSTKTPVHQFSLAPQARKLIAIPLPAGIEEATLSIDSDPFEEDNSVHLMIPPQKVVTLYHSFQNEKIASHLKKGFSIVPRVQWVQNARQAHLQIHPRSDFRPPRPGALQIFLGSPFQEEETYLGPFVTAVNHPLMKFTSFEGVLWTASPRVEKEDLFPLLTVEKTPLIYEKKGDYFFNLNLEKSNLIKSPDWPNLCFNFTEMVRKSLPGLSTYNPRPGERVYGQLNIGPEEETYLVRGGDKKDFYLTSEVDFKGPRRPGIYEIQTEDKLLARFSVNLLDSRESNLLLARKKEDLSPEKAPTQLKEVEDLQNVVLHSFLLLIALVFLLADWWVLSRRS